MWRKECKKWWWRGVGLKGAIMMTTGDVTWLTHQLHFKHSALGHYWPEYWEYFICAIKSIVKLYLFNYLHLKNQINIFDSTTGSHSPVLSPGSYWTRYDCWLWVWFLCSNLVYSLLPASWQLSVRSWAPTLTQTFWCCTCRLVYFCGTKAFYRYETFFSWETL